MKPTLYVMAAGMGSRYGGLKQMDGIGPNNETIIDYSIFDAIRAGFGKVVFVIRHDFADDFKKVVIAKFADKIPVDIVYQELNKLPEGFTVNPERKKPWGTNHAILMGKDVVKEPFAVINGDDFYGQESFQVLCDELVKMEGKTGEYCMVGFPVKNTLSESGTVSRGVCQKDSNGYLTSIVEHTKIEENGGVIVNHNDDGTDTIVTPETPVSMNMWGFTPDYFKYSEDFFKEFLKENEKSLKAEFYIPTMVDHLIKTGEAKVKVLSTSSKWFGVTYAADKPTVLLQINSLISKGKYPKKLWE
ncbi:MAG: nucleotidyltransferase [Paludibacteraceae bacterium]|nr:nucleotidyltransferase [Paludibacteraceae bacterium]MBQ6732791.1 nucleotidyltransferase [Paludibacteraceae bacterium]MBQ6766768.1 nucleotidyltransferase [Paludibacteraceae bacterium]MDY6373395.1 nucleotidyltransferase [Bacteroidales bacterium]